MITKKRAKVVVAPKQSKPNQRQQQPKPHLPKPSIAHKLELLTRSILEQYPNDPTFPGLKLSYLSNCNQFYASICRYREIYGKGGYQILKAQANTMEVTINTLIERWVEQHSPRTSATEELISRS